MWLLAWARALVGDRGRVWVCACRLHGRLRGRVVVGVGVAWWRVGACVCGCVFFKEKKFPFFQK